MVSRPEIVALRPITEVVFLVNFAICLFLQAQRVDSGAGDQQAKRRRLRVPSGSAG